MRKLLFFSFFLLIAIDSIGQQAQVDSLEQLLNTTFKEGSSNRVNVLVEASELLLRINPDRSLSMSKEALRLSVLLGYKDQISHIYNNTGTANRLKGLNQGILGQVRGILAIAGHVINDREQVLAIFLNELVKRSHIAGLHLLHNRPIKITLR